MVVLRSRLSPFRAVIEVLNSDVYENWVNTQVAGNQGGVWADGGSMHGLPASASIVIPANAILVFAAG